MTSPEPLVSVIEDDESLAQAITRLLRSAGYRASWHGSAEAFLASDDAGEATCIVTDIQLPGMSGIALMAQLQKSSAAGTRVIMITARVEKDLHAQAIGSGAFCFLQKPFAADILLDCVARAVACAS